MEEKQNISLTKLKHAVLVFFFLLFFTPMIQQHFPFVKEKPLIGVDNSLKTPNISFTDWLSGDFQKKLDEALYVNIGFRKTLVRIHSQVLYSIFNITKAGAVVIGKEGYLYDHSYIKAYTGGDFVGIENINIQIQKAIVVQAELKKKNIDLILAFAPGKGSYYSEFIPDQHLNMHVVDSSNYVCYTRACTDARLPFIDLREYFLSIKDTVVHPVFSQVGVHWSDYGAFLAIDTLSKYIAKIRNIKMNRTFVSSFQERDSIKRQDKDVLNLLNIFSDVSYFSLPYLKFHVLKDTSNIKPKLLAVSDSYFSTIVATGLVDSLYSDWNYWLYNVRLSNKNQSFNFKNEIEKRDVILILATDATLCQFPYGFIDEAYEVYAPKNKLYFELKNREFRQFITEGFKNIEKDKKWKRQLNKSAKEKKGSTIDEYIGALLWLYNEQEVKQ